MGCGHVTNQAVSPKQLLISDVPYLDVGFLNVQIQQINYIDKNRNDNITQENYFKISLSNQQYITILHHNFGNNMKIRPSKNIFSFIINKTLQQRIISIEIFRKQQLRIEKKIGQGKEIIQKVITKPTQNQLSRKQEFRIKLTTADQVKIAWVKTNIQFIPLKYKLLNVKVNSVTLRSRCEYDRKVYVRIQIGQEIFQSVSALQTTKSLPQWSDALHSFIVPQSLMQGLVQVYQKKSGMRNDCLLGQLRFDLKQLFNETGLRSYSQPLSLKNQISGSIKVQFAEVKHSDVDSFRMNSPKKISISKKQSIANQYNSAQEYHFNSLKKKTDYPTTNASDNKFHQDLFSIKIKRSSKQGSKEGSNQIRKSKLNNVLPPIQSAPALYKQQKSSNFNKTIPTAKNQLNIYQNPESKVNIENISDIINGIDLKQNQKNLSDHEIVSRVIILKTQSILINKKQSQTQQQQIQNLIQKLKDQTNHDNIRIKQIQSDNDDEAQANLFQKDLQQKQQTNNNLLYSRTIKFIPQQQYYDSRNSCRLSNKKQVKKQSKLKFDIISDQLQSKPLQLFKNSVVNIEINDNYQYFDFVSLKQQSNLQPRQKQKNDQTESWQLVHIQNDGDNKSEELNDTKFRKRVKLLNDNGLEEGKPLVQYDNQQFQKKSQSILNSRLLKQQQQQFKQNQIINLNNEPIPT